MSPFRFAASILAFVAMLSLAVVRSPVMAGPESLPSAIRARDLAPPHFPDDVHIFNGCHVSTLAYLARFHAEFPGERGEPFVVRLPDAQDVVRSHTVAVVSWQGAWWGRDEYFGVYPLRLRAETTTNRDGIVAALKACHPAHVRAMLRRPGALQPPPVPRQLSGERLLAEVTTASRLVPGGSTIFWIRSGAERDPFAFFRFGDRRVGVYHPLIGTCTTRCDSTDDAAIVGAVLRQIGFRVDDVGTE